MLRCRTANFTRLLSTPGSKSCCNSLNSTHTWPIIDHLLIVDVYNQAWRHLQRVTQEETNRKQLKATLSAWLYYWWAGLTEGKWTYIDEVWWNFNLARNCCISVAPNTSKQEKLTRFKKIFTNNQAVCSSKLVSLEAMAVSGRQNVVIFKLWAVDCGHTSFKMTLFNSTLCRTFIITLLRS